MTRETKIGLLVGLGFIVVFAVLLSHTGTVPPPGETPMIVQNNRADSPVLDGNMHDDITKQEPAPVAVEAAPAPGSGPEAEPAPTMRDAVVSAGGVGDDLPKPGIFNSHPAGSLSTGSTMEVASADRKRGDVSPDNLPLIVGMRKAPDLPEVVTPQPTPRPNSPIASATPAATPSLATDAIARQSAQPEKTAPTLAAAAPREYVVQSRDTLTRIAEKYYGSASPRVVKLIVKSNEGRIKDANSVTQGQKLVIPNLPAEMFENAPGFDVRVVSGKGKPLSTEEFAQGSKARKMPKPTDRTLVPILGGTPEKEPPGSLFKLASGTETGLAAVPKPSLDRTLDLRSLMPADLPPTAGTPSTGSKETVTPKPNKETSNKDAGAKDATSKSKSSKDGKSLKETKESKDTRETRPSRERESKPAKALVKNDKGDDMYRWYEVKPNDTLATIAKDSLGSTQRWQEIKRLNNGVDPQRMRPGERIKVPRSKPLSSAMETGRASA